MEQPSILSKAYNCDCLEYMRKLPDNYFDLAIADPPYGIGASKPSKKVERARQADGSVLQVPVTDFTKKDWDNTIPSQEFFDELRRVSRNQIIWGANYFGLQGGMIVWDKINGNSDQYDCEIAYQSFNKRTDLVHYMWNGMFQGKYCGRDIRQAVVQQGNKALNEKRIHPTQKPVILYEWLLTNYAKKGDRIFDPMMGSQSSRIAAHRLGFDYVGCELDKEYYDKGCTRFDSMFSKNNQTVGDGIQTASKDMKKIPNTKEELIALVGNDYKRETNFGALFVTETEDYGRKESRKVSGISIRDNNIQFMGIHAPKSWEALTPDGQKKVCQWVHDNLELTRQLPDMFYHALNVLKDAETATGKQKEGYNMFQRLKNGLYLGESTYDPYYQFWAGKVSNDFRYFIQPTELEKSSHYKELADALAIMPRSDIEKFAKEVENHPQRKVMCLEIDNQNNLRESKGNLRNVLDNAKIDLGNTYKISPLDINMGNWTAHVDTIKYNPEFELDYYVASGIDKEGGHSNILIHKLDNMTSIGELTKAVHEAHVKNLEQDAKQAIHDRIVTPSARRFTSDQVEVLNRYHQVAAQDKPAGEVFKELLQEVSQEPDVARKPEKWVTDTAKELDDLAKGITRDQVRGLHK